MTIRLPSDPHPAEVAQLRWGVLGTGSIAQRFLRATRAHTSQRVIAVAARDPARVRAFAAANAPLRPHASVEGLLLSPDIDAVYIATPHTSHADLALSAVAAGKHTLVEKPFAVNADDVRAVEAAGAASGVLVMEAMWTRYLPQSGIVRRLVADGELGAVQSVHARIGIRAPTDTSHRLWDPDLAGGATWDLGVYGLAFAADVLGPLDLVGAAGVLTPDGVDLSSTALLRTASGAHSVIECSLTVAGANDARIVGENGSIVVRAPFFQPTGLCITRHTPRGDTTQTWTDNRFSSPYEAMSDQVAAFASFVAAGLRQSTIHPLSEVTATVELLSQIRLQLREHAQGSSAPHSR